MTPKQKALVLADAVAAKKGIELQVLDLEGLCSFADFFVIATGTSARHVVALADAVQEAGRTTGEKPLGVEGTGPARWVLVDFGDVVVHLFQADAREFYGLERLWGEAPAVEMPRAAGGAG